MYLHIGNDYTVRTKDIIGIFDIENTSLSKDTRDFLKMSEKNKRVIYTTFEMPKSFIVCLDESLTEKIYVSQLACATLRKRFENQKSKKYSDLF